MRYQGSLRNVGAQIANRLSRLASPTVPAEKGVQSNRRGVPLVLLLCISTSAFIDRSILNTVGQAIKDDLHISDLQLGLLGGAAFALLYGVLCVPVARLSERYSRVRIICVAVVVWSLMTLICGFARSFSALLIARVGVGVGEAGVVAPSQSLLADIYPPERRASAVAILGLAIPLGIIIGGIGGGIFAQRFGWRGAFEFAAIPGLVLAGLTYWAVREPERGASENKGTDDHVPSIGDVVRRLWSSRAYRHILYAGAVTSFIGFGMVTFTHPFFVRAYSMDYTQAAVAFVLINSVSNAGGFLIGGLVTDRLIKRNRRFYGWLPAIGAFAACPLYVLGFLQVHWLPAVLILMLPGLFSATWYAPTYAVTQNLVTPRMRASAVALTSLVFNLTGMTLGPAVTGALSDYFATRRFVSGNYALQCTAIKTGAHTLCQAASASGIRMALIILVSFFLLSGMHFMLAAKHMKRGVESFDRPGNATSEAA
jgi:MFS family permease